MQHSTIETIKEKLSIESVVGSYIKLERTGKNFRACCPFHHEKTPSFYITPERGMYYCYGCHKGGDIFSFVEEIEGLNFRDTLVHLAEKAGVTLDDRDHRETSRLAVLRDIMETATRYYEVGLRTTKTVVTYLEGRGMTKDTMVNFRIGYAPSGWSGLYEALRKKKYQDADILATGLCIQGDRGLYDRFRERIMFPITDTQGRVIAFTGRVMPGTREAERPVGKYINSPETDLYHKSNILFGYDKAKRSIQEQGYVILVEGQMDCIMSHQAGVTHVVALSGTAATDAHLHQLNYFTQSIALCLDADRAGIQAAQKTAQLAYREGMQVFAIPLLPGTDPAELIYQDQEAWKTAVAHKEKIVTFLLRVMTPNDREHKSHYAEEILFPLLTHHHSPITLDEYFREIAHAFELSGPEPIREAFQNFLKKQGELPEKKSPLIPLSVSEQGKGVASARTYLKALLAHYHHIFTPRKDGDTTDEAIQIRESYDRIMSQIHEHLAHEESHYLELEAENTYNEAWFEMERNYGSFPEEFKKYESAGYDLIVRIHREYLTEQLVAKQQLLIQDPHNEQLQKDIYQLQVARDALVRAIT